MELLEADDKETGYTWGQMEKLTWDRNPWPNQVGGLLPRVYNGIG